MHSCRAFMARFNERFAKFHPDRRICIVRWSARLISCATCLANGSSAMSPGNCRCPTNAGKLFWRRDATSSWAGRQIRRNLRVP